MIQYPKISVVTPCFNMENTVAQTLNSIFSQEYQNLEHIFVDGGSTDGTLTKVAKYRSSISTLISEKDDGQYDAINKGMRLATGDICSWLNADDIYMPWTFDLVAKIFSDFPEIDWIIGLPTFINKEGHCTRVSNNPVGYSSEWVRNGWYRSHLGGYLQQESMFWRKSLWEKVGGLDTSFRLAGDFDLWTRFAQFSQLTALSVPLAAFRMMPGFQRSSAQRSIYEKEVGKICENLESPNGVWRFMASKGVAARSLCRLFTIKKTPIIAYSESRMSWEKRSVFNTVSRVSLPAMKLEYDLRGC